MPAPLICCPGLPDHLIVNRSLMAAERDNSPRPSFEDIGLDLGALYRISEGSEKAQEPEANLALQHLLLVACFGSNATRNSSSRVRTPFLVLVLILHSKMRALSSCLHFGGGPPLKA